MSFSFLRNLINLILGQFWPSFAKNLRIRFFPEKKVQDFICYNFIQNNQKNSQIPKKFHAFFEKLEKPHFVPFCPENTKTIFFSNNQVPSLFKLDNLTTPNKESENSYEQFWRKTLHKQEYFIGPSLLRVEKSSAIK